MKSWKTHEQNKKHLNARFDEKLKTKRLMFFASFFSCDLQGFKFQVVYIDKIGRAKRFRILFFWSRHLIKIFKKGLKKRCISSNVWSFLFWQSFIIFLTNQIRSPVKGEATVTCKCVKFQKGRCVYRRIWLCMRNEFVFTMHRARNAHAIKNI